MGKLDEAAKKRVRAGRLLLGGKSPAAVAKQVGVARQTAYTWQARLDEGGIDALRAMAKGRPGLLDDRQREELRRMLLQSPIEHGFGTALWTLKRVRLLIERCFDVAYSEAHVWRILDALGFSPQRPDRRAIERDEAAVLAWKRKTWPALKKSAPPSAD